MAERRSAANSNRTAAERTAQRFTADERAAMRDRAQELRRARGGSSKADGEADLLAKVAEMPEPDRDIARRLHDLIRVNAPDLAPRTWYGMPAYAKDGSVLCFFKPASKFNARYATLGFSDKARLDDDGMWPTEFALARLTSVEQASITALLKKALD